MNQFRFELIYQSTKSRARAGIIHTPHGPIHTPSFVAVGTNGALKAVDSHTVDQLGLELMFCNTYHLLLHPGTDVIRAAGGLHQFIGRTKPIITDSGGFQVFSLAYGSVHDELKSRGSKKIGGSVLSITENGVLFRSYRDGAPVLLTPELSVQAQKDLGADIIIPFDELPPYHTSRTALKRSLERTHRWEERSLNTHQAHINNQALYAVIHGGVDRQLRAHSVATLTQLPFDGWAIGGSLGKNHPELFELLNYLMPLLPPEKPNHLLGIGDLGTIEPIIQAGVDTFDSSYPTRCARHGLLFTNTGFCKILQSRYKRDFTPIDPTCLCPTCKNYTAAYIHHLFKAHELTAYTLATIHNVAHMINRVTHLRDKILNGAI